MNVAVCQRVVEALAGLAPPALHVGSLALNEVPAQFDGLHLLIHEDALPDFHERMRGAGFHLAGWLPGAQATHSVPDGTPLRSHPLTPNLGYTDRIGAPCTVWIQLYTHLRHGPLLLVNLAHWFDDPQPIPEFETFHAKRPHMWALLLWQASLVTTCAADRADPTVVETEVGVLNAIAQALPNWDDVRTSVNSYDGEYLHRLASIQEQIGRYAHNRGLEPSLLVASPVDDSTVPAAKLDYGPRYDLRYALKALRRYYPGTEVPNDLLGPTGTGNRPRKLWHYPSTPGNVGELGTADEEFGIYEQVQPESMALTWEQLQAPHTNGLQPVADPNGFRGAPPEGYWSELDFTAEEFRHFLRPV